MTHKECEKVREFAPHVVHCVISIATLVMTAKILHKVCHLRAALRDFKEGEKEQARPTM